MARLDTSQDTAAGLLFLAIALLVLVAGGQLPFGTPAQMGAGFVPMLLGTGLLILSVVILLRAWHQPAAPPLGRTGETWAWRPLATVLGAALTFALLVPHAGLLLSAFATVVIAGFAAERPRLLELMAFAVGLAVVVAVVFIGLLGLPIAWMP